MALDDVIETFDQAIAAFAETERELPIGAMLWCRDNWDAAAPDLIAIIERYADGTDRTEAAANAVLFILHLAAEQRETRALAPVCRLARDLEAIETVISDTGVTESLPSILIGVCGDDPAPIKALIEAADADEFVRAAALQALGYLTAADRLPLAETAKYLPWLYDTLEPKMKSYVWDAWAEAATLLRLDGTADRVERLFAQGLLDDEYGDADDFRELRESALADATPLASFEREHIGPFEDAIDELSQWACFSGSDDDDVSDADLEKWALREDRGIPAVNPYKDVGRNDPCPCGSGKKFKKCCLPTAA